MTHRSVGAFVTLRVGLAVILTLGVAAACAAPPRTAAPTHLAISGLSLTIAAQLTATPVPTYTSHPADTPVLMSTPVATPILTVTPTGIPAPAEAVGDLQTVTVCADGRDFTTIQAAIDDPATLPGHTISVTDAAHTEAGIIVNKDVTIQGQGAETSVVQAHERAGQARDRVFFIPQGATVTLKNLTVRHGYAREDIRSGGAIENRGTLTVSRCVIRDNQANCGGGIYNQGGALTVTDSTIRDNQADGEAPTGYECGSGGAIKVTEGGTLALTNSTVSGNRARLRGGGVYVSCKSTAALVNSTISGNTAGGRGGGINIGGIVHLTHCTITGNSAKGELRRNQVDAQPAGGVSVRGTLHYTNTLIANNPMGGACVPGPSAVIGANVYNLVEDGGCS